MPRRPQLPLVPRGSSGHRRASRRRPPLARHFLATALAVVVFAAPAALGLPVTAEPTSTPGAGGRTTDIGSSTTTISVVDDDNANAATAAVLVARTRASPSCVVDPALRVNCTGTFQDDFLAHDRLELAPMWEGRARAAAPFLRGAMRVLDYGSGTGFLRSLLDPAVVAAGGYHAVDIRSHSDYTAEVCNANAGFVTRNASGLYDRVALLGVLEYICNPPAFLEYLRTFDAQVVMSYTARYPGVATLGLADTVSLDELLQMTTAAGFLPRVVGRLELPFHTKPQYLQDDIPQVLLVLQPDHGRSDDGSDRRDSVPPDTQLRGARRPGWTVSSRDNILDPTSI